MNSKPTVFGHETIHVENNSLENQGVGYKLGHHHHTMPTTCNGATTAVCLQAADDLENSPKTPRQTLCSTPANIRKLATKDSLNEVIIA
jgi:hypothetical protein